MVHLSNHLILVHAHLVQFLRLANQDVLACFVQVHGLRQVLALPGPDRFPLSQASSAANAAEADDSVSANQKLLLLLALVRCPSPTGVRLRAIVVRWLSLAR